MLHNNFIKIISQESHEFKALMKVLILINQYADEGRKLLCLINHIIDFYVFRETEGGKDVKMPIIYFPLCAEWAQRLCEDFVALKLSTLFGDTYLTGVKNELKNRDYIYFTGGLTKKEKEALSKQYKFRRSIAKNLTDVISFPLQDNEKVLFYSRAISNQYNRSVAHGCYHFCNDTMGISLNSGKKVVLLGEAENKLYKEIEENDGKQKFPYVFLFLQKDLDGRNIPFCMQMQRSTINEYNEDFDAGIKTVFFFAFSQKPYRLQRISENKHNLVERLQREKIAETRDFISFTKEEMDYLFGRQNANINLFNLEYEYDSEQHQIKNAFDLMLQDLAHEVKLRNELAICFTERSIAKIKESILEQNPETNEEYVDYYLKLLKQMIKSNAEPILFGWCCYNQIAVVLDYNVNEYYKNQLKDFLKNECGATSVCFYTFKNFRAYKNGSVFLNTIKENKILVFSILNHCTGRNWAIYPNSFDQYHLNLGQNVLQVNNKFVFDPRYSWYQYRYEEQQKLLLNSDFRIKYIKSEIVLPSKPINIGPEPQDDEDEQNIRGRQYGREQKRVVVKFGSRQHRILYDDELVLCRHMDELDIYSVSDVMRIFDDPSDIQIQPLIDFHDPLDLFIDNSVRKEGEGENIMRNNPKYGLTEEERTSKREMWKIMLEHKVAQLGKEVVYNEIMEKLLPMERIRYLSFCKWLDTSESSILPRNRRMQRRVIEEYLGIEPLYTRMLRHRKSRTSTNTEGKNSIFRSFLTHCLLETDIQKAYDGLSYEVRDYLNIANKDDIPLIIELIKDEVLNLKSIKSIEYDQK